MQKRAIFFAIFSLFIFQKGFTAEGQLDASFGNQGIVYTDFQDEYPATWFGASEAGALSLAKDGKIIAAGTAKYAFFPPPSENLPPGEGEIPAPVPVTLYGMGGDFALVRYLADGSLDKSFGGNGKVVTDFSPHFKGASLSMDSAVKVKLQSDGKIVVLGNLMGLIGESSDSRIGISRYLANGDLDTQFNASSPRPGSFTYRGEKLFDAGSEIIHLAYDLAIDPQGRILVAAASIGKIQGSVHMISVVMRLNPDGSLDSSFNPNGIQAGVLNEVIQALNNAQGDSLQSLSAAQSLVLKGDDIYVLGSYLPSYEAIPQMDLYLEKISENGSRDLQFGSQGLLFPQASKGKSEIAHQLHILKNSNLWMAALSGDKVILEEVNSSGTLGPLLEGNLFSFESPSAASNSIFLKKRFSSVYSECSDKILFAYTAADDATKPTVSDVAVSRWTREAVYDSQYNPSGNNPGLSLIETPNSLETTQEIGLQSDGKALVVATTNAGNGKNKIAVLRLLGKDDCSAPENPPTETQPTVPTTPTLPETHPPQAPTFSPEEQATPAETEDPATSGGLSGNELLQGGGGCMLSLAEKSQPRPLSMLFWAVPAYLFFFRKRTLPE